MRLVICKHIKTGPRSYARTVPTAIAGGWHVQVVVTSCYSSSVQITSILHALHRHAAVSMPLIRSRHVALTRPAFLCLLEMLLQVVRTRAWTLLLLSLSLWLVRVCQIRVATVGLLLLLLWYCVVVTHAAILHLMVVLLHGYRLKGSSGGVVAAGHDHKAGVGCRADQAASWWGHHVEHVLWFVHVALVAVVAFVLGRSMIVRVYRDVARTHLPQQTSPQGSGGSSGTGAETAGLILKLVSLGPSLTDLSARQARANVVNVIALILQRVHNEIQLIISQCLRWIIPRDITSYRIPIHLLTKLPRRSGEHLLDGTLALTALLHILRFGFGHLASKGIPKSVSIRNMIHIVAAIILLLMLMLWMWMMRLRVIIVVVVTTVGLRCYIGIHIVAVMPSSLLRMRTIRFRQKVHGSLTQYTRIAAHHIVRIVYIRCRPRILLLLLQLLWRGHVLLHLIPSLLLSWHWTATTAITHMRIRASTVRHVTAIAPPIAIAGIVITSTAHTTVHATKRAGTAHIRVVTSTLLLLRNVHTAIHRM
mmetsp:Transcript_12530/g.18798  ORF Transcript_12530/g.18798 Transcript_12530/m.18798 type:complete len:534 (-) Transcript_12530:40-1641(-)